MNKSPTLTLSRHATPLKQSGIRKASARCSEINGINLGQGVCDIPTDDVIKSAAVNAIVENKNLYAPHEGIWELRQTLAQKIKQFNQVDVNPQTEILVSHGSTGSYVSAAKTLFNPGDEVILLEPFYGYHKYILELLGITVISTRAEQDDYQVDFAKIESIITSKTRGIVICTPCNPSGKVFTKDELIKMGELAKKNNLYIITDEIYEYITYPGHEHISIASLNDYRDRTITISGFSKTYNVTGWRLGYSYGPAEIIQKMALVHDLLYICPPTPLQHAMIAALHMDQSYIDDMRASFLNKRNLIVKSLREMGFKMRVPQGSYYLMVDFSELNLADNDEDASSLLLEQAKVATVPARSFYHDPEMGKYQLRLCFALSEDKINMAVENIREYLNNK